MEKYQDYIVHVEPLQWDRFQLEFRKIIECNFWKLREDLMNRGKYMVATTRKGLFCIETPEIKYKQASLKGVLWIWFYNNHLEVFNIIPLLGNHLTCNEYNYLLACFDSSIIEPMSKMFNLKIEISKPYLDIEDIIGREAFHKLELFSEMANKSTGHSHPMDAKRWMDFVISVYSSYKHLSTDDLSTWLIGSGWDETMAHELSIDFEYSIELLEYYEQNQEG